MTPPRSFLERSYFTFLIAQANGVAIAYHYSAGMVTWGKERKARSILLEQERYYTYQYSRTGLLR